MTSDTRLHIIMSISLVILGSVLFSLIYMINTVVDKDVSHLYNCSIAEISPDFTPAMKEECRLQRKK
jgi:hypothetical protein